MPSFVDLTGRKFDRLTVILRMPSVRGKTLWNCECSCGGAKITRADALLDGMTRSCGCLHAEWATSKHGPREKPSILERFEDRYIPEPNSGCWLWFSNVNPSTGYGRFYIDEEQKVLAHQFSFAHYKGRLPHGLIIRHTCDIKCCVNPEHLIPGTHKQNTQDAIERGQHSMGIRSPHAKLSEAEVLIVFSAQESISEIARRFSISRMQVQRIKEKKTWRKLLCAL